MIRGYFDESCADKRVYAIGRFCFALAFFITWLSYLPSVSAQNRSVALTFDDLPADSISDADSANRAILDSLRQHHAPATGFVIEEKVQEIANGGGKDILWQWVQDGHDLANHTFSHRDFNELTTEQMKEEIVSGAASISELLERKGQKPHYFRFPMNHTGNTPMKHRAIAVFLAEQGYRVAACTIENEDFLFNSAYLRMLTKQDQASSRQLRADYLAYTSSEIDYYAGLNEQIFGYEPPEVMVLHVNRLNAEMIEEILRLFEQKHYVFVTLEKAQSDPAFATPDTFVSPYGPMWGYRWAAERGIKVNGKLEKEPPAWISSYPE
jgi:peptidoglycan-N-acetylglucosamine deacetylase